MKRSYRIPLQIAQAASVHFRVWRRMWLGLSSPCSLNSQEFPLFNKAQRKKNSDEMPLVVDPGVSTNVCIFSKPSIIFYNISSWSGSGGFPKPAAKINSTLNSWWGGAKKNGVNNPDNKYAGGGLYAFSNVSINKALGSQRLHFERNELFSDGILRNNKTRLRLQSLRQFPSAFLHL